jgi:hypothetical protein
MNLVASLFGSPGVVRAAGMGFVEVPGMSPRTYVSQHPVSCRVFDQYIRGSRKEIARSNSFRRTNNRPIHLARALKWCGVSHEAVLETAAKRIYPERPLPPLSAERFMDGTMEGAAIFFYRPGGPAMAELFEAYGLAENLTFRGISVMIDGAKVLVDFTLSAPEELSEAVKAGLTYISYDRRVNQGEWTRAKFPDAKNFSRDCDLTSDQGMPILTPYFKVASYSGRNRSESLSNLPTFHLTMRPR